MQRNTGDHIFAATCGTGSETLVYSEIERLGGKDIEQDKGVVNWRGPLETGLNACLWSRFASRVLLLVSSFSFSDEDSLYERALEIAWWDHLEQKTTFAVDCTVAGKTTRNLHSRYAALRVKDAIVDRLRDYYGERPSVDTRQPGVRVHLLLYEGVARISIDLSGDSLHLRGYRQDRSLAPLKENLAATIVAQSGWPETASESTPLIDPMCGSGTLLIEAALQYGDSAPGLSRSYFGFFGWKQHDSALWQRLVDDALEREEMGSERPWPLIIGYDASSEAVKAARRNIRRAGLDDRITIEKQELFYLQPPAGKGTLLSNLPFGERLSEREQVKYLYRAFGRIARQRFPGWRVAAFISAPELTDSFNLQWLQKYRLYNGPLQCRLLVTNLATQKSKDFRWEIAGELPEAAEADFANRLRKNFKKMLKWSTSEKVHCFRVYDRDLPEYNVSIDLYEKWVLVQEYAPPASVASDLAAQRFQRVLRGVRETLGLRADRVFVKRREKQRGKRQYQQKAGQKKMYEVREGECHYLVNFIDYLDTGVFLDHRPVRNWIHESVSGKRFLNLFGYTGTATVQAAAGGAVATTTVDLSSVYLKWAAMNLALNGFGFEKNHIVSADCVQWLKENTDIFDVIFLDPPTFSNTKKERRVFDIQRDHQQLINLAMSRLAEQGVLYFSTNFRKFKLAEEVIDTYQVTNRTAASIPFDFSRNERIHKCWEIRKRETGTSNGEKG